MSLHVIVYLEQKFTAMNIYLLQAPLICDYQTAKYVLTIKDTTDPNVVVEPIQSTYTGSDRNIMEVVTLIIDHNYTLFISVIENHFKIKVSKSKKFSMSNLCNINF